MRRGTALVLAAVALAGCREKTKEQVLQAAEDKARLETEKRSRAIKGVGEGLQTAGKEGAQSLSKGVGEVLRGSAKGFDASLSAVQVAAGPGLQDAGLKVERAARQASQPPTITAYLVADQRFAGTLRLRALDDEGREVGRAQAVVKQDAGDAGYVDFAFDGRVPLTAVTAFEMSVLR